MPAVRRFAAGDAPAVAAIIRGLPDYFTDDVPAKAEHDAADHEAWVITDQDGVAGFAIAARKSPGGAEILWIAVDAARRGHGHGTRLLGHVLDGLAAAGVSVVEAKTLDGSSGYQPYEATRAFWERTEAWSQSGAVSASAMPPSSGSMVWGRQVRGGGAAWPRNPCLFRLFRCRRGRSSSTRRVGCSSSSRRTKAAGPFPAA